MDTDKRPRNEDEIKKEEANEFPPDADDTNRRSDEIREEKNDNNN